MKIVEFIKTKNHYEILNEALMKNPETRKWQDCVIYQQYENFDDKAEVWYPVIENALIFVREKTDFWNKFKLLGEEIE